MDRLKNDSGVISHLDQLTTPIISIIMTSIEFKGKWGDYPDSEEEEMGGEVLDTFASTPPTPNCSPVVLPMPVVASDLNEPVGSWRVQGRPRIAIRKAVSTRQLLVFASLPFAHKLEFRGIVAGEDAMLTLVREQNISRFHGYDPIGHMLVWRRRQGDDKIGVERASAVYIARVEKQFKEQIKKLSPAS